MTTESDSKPKFWDGAEEQRREHLLKLLKEKLIPPTAPPKLEGLSLNAHGTLYLIKEIAARKGALGAPCVADVMHAFATELIGVLTELEENHLIRHGDWKRLETTILLMTH